MSTQVMTPSTGRSAAPAPEPSIRDIIAAARSTPVRAPARAAWGLSLASGLLLWASFTPLDWAPLAWLALVPLCLLIRTPVRTRWLYSAVYFGGLVQSVASLQWMRLGDPSMYFAWMALAFYVAMYLPMFVACCRAAVHRWNIPMTLAVPVVWTGLEFFRAHLLTGFSWYYLGHSQYRWTTLIQISDVVGAYGVSFVMAMTAAGLAGMLPLAWMGKLRLFLTGTDPLVMQAGEPCDLRTVRRQVAVAVACVAVVAATLVYGAIRRGQAAFVEGPKVALIQGNFTASLKHDPNAARDIFNTHHRLMGMAVFPHHPDVIIWPETMYRHPLMVASPDLSPDDLARVAPGVPNEMWRQSAVTMALSDMAKQAGAALFIGIDTLDAREDKLRHFNSAAFIRPDTGYVGRYDKLHLVPFGEYLPLRNALPALQVFSPIPQEFGLTPGESARTFTWKDCRMAPVVCFEDTVPHLVRDIMKATRDPETGATADCLVNLTNDGWFHGSSELDQHLITASFRAVECRTPMVRAVNTGISALIDGDGVIRDPEVFIDGDGQGRTTLRDPKTGRWHKQLNAVSISHIPLDNRSSLYVRLGDWFAAMCGFCCLSLALSRFLPQRKVVPAVA